MPAEHDEMEPPQIAVEMPRKRRRKALDLAVGLVAVWMCRVRLRVPPARSVAAGAPARERGRAAVSSSMLETQSRNCTRSISLSPISNANRELVDHPRPRITN